MPARGISYSGTDSGARTGTCSSVRTFQRSPRFYPIDFEVRPTI